MKIERYGVYLANLNPTKGAEMNKTRPVIVISNDAMNAALGTVVICPLTAALHSGWRSRIQTSFVGKRGEIAVDQIRAISKERIVRKLDQGSPSIAKELRELISEMYGE
jgi:mRNA interferase MazF